MDLDSAITRYLHDPVVARWLFCTDDVREVTPAAMAASFVYAIGWGMYPPGAPRTMNIEDMLIVTGQSGTFVLGVIWGLSQPHVFATTPLMLHKKPLARRFAVDFSARDALEFMEFASFADGKVMVMFRQFIHTHDLSLPCVASARLHAESRVDQTLGPVLMRADLFEAASCPRCGQVGKACRCSFDSYAPNAAVRKSTYTWNQFSSSFMRKARVGTVKLRMTAMLPDVGELRIVDDEIPVLNVLQKGDTDYMNLLRTKAVHGLGITVIPPRADTLVMAKAVELDFIDLHNSYVMRKRVREAPHIDDDEIEPLLPSPHPQEPAVLDLTAVHGFMDEGLGAGSDSIVGACSDSIQSVDDIFSIFPNFLNSATSPSHPDLLPTPDPVLQDAQVPIAQPGLIPSNDSFDPFSKPEPEIPAHLLLNSDLNDTSATNVLEQLTTKDDILNSIELILSPPGSQSQTTPAQPLPQEQNSLAMLSNSTLASDPLRSSSVSTEHSTGQVAVPPPPQSKTYESAKKRKKTTTKRSKPRATPGGENDAERKHACTTCEKKFKNRGDLLRHVKVLHEGKRNHVCETCGKKFGHSGHLNRHIQSVHLQQRRFKCEFCGFPFFQASHLQSHISHIHGQKKDLACGECGFRAASQTILKSHIADVHSAPQQADILGCPFPDCDETYAAISDLNIHVLTSHSSVSDSNTMGLQMALAANVR